MRPWVRAASGAALVVGGAPLWNQAVAPAGAAGGQPAEHRAAVLVDTGTEVKSVCVRFREESISGIEALQRAAVDPVLQAFSGKGAAVCSLCGVGCPAGESCLTCNAEGRFWSYSRAPAGTTALRTSGVGASSTTVRDGDVEGWRWGLGGAPPFVTVQQVCGEAATTTTSTGATTLPSPIASTVPSPSTPSTGATVPRTGPPSGASTTATAAFATTSAPGTTTTGPTGPTEPDATSRSTLGAAAPASTERESGGGSSMTGLALLAVALGGLLVWSARLRRSRRAPSSQ